MSMFLWQTIDAANGQSLRNNLVRITHSRNLETVLAPADPNWLPSSRPVCIAKSQLRRFPESDEENFLGPRTIIFSMLGMRLQHLAAGPRHLRHRSVSRVITRRVTAHDDRAAPRCRGRDERAQHQLAPIVAVENIIDGAVACRVPDRLLIRRLQIEDVQHLSSPGGLAKRSSRAFSSASVMFARIRPPLGLGASAARPPLS